MATTNQVSREFYLEPIYEHKASYYKKAVVKTMANGDILFYSYGTLICFIKGTKIYFTYAWDYSATTLRHVKEFLSQYFTELKNAGKKDIEKYIKENEAYAEHGYFQ